MPSVPVVTATLLGSFKVTVAGREIPERAWGSRKAQQLVKLLALAPQYRLTIEQALDALWPDQDPDSLTAAFRQACYLARKALAHPDLLVVRGGGVTLAPPATCTVDAVGFERAAATAFRTRAEGDYVAALDRYTGALLPDDRYSDWVLVPAERLRLLATKLRGELAASREQAGEDAAAEALWQQVLADDATDEAAHVGLMRLYARQGQRQRAVRQYHLLHGRLRDDLDVAPEPATGQLYAAILSGQYPPPVGTVPMPPPATLPPHTLPATLTTLIGRTAEIVTVGDLLGGARLVTLTGPGGSGKTRLALAVAERLLPTYPDGVWWVELASLTDDTLVVGAVAQVLGIVPTPGQMPLDALTTALRGRRLLLILDNAEHLRVACADLTLALLRECPDVRVLVTSRAALRAVGEQIWRVPPLPLPASVEEWGEEGDLAALAENDAVALFASRARLVRVDFALTPGNAASVVSICRRVEGLPLALELAAARIGLLDPRQLAVRLDDAVGLLTGGAQGLPDRQRTLRATLDWSYGLLAEGEQRLLRQLSSFAGGWTLAAAEAVCGGEDFAVLAGLTGLVEHSLVQLTADSDAEEPRYRLLEPLRQYARARLVASGAEATTREAHARYFLALAEAIQPKLEGQLRVTWLRRLRGEIDNLREALNWWQGPGTIEPRLRLAAALRLFWRQQAYIREGWDWLNTVEQAGGEAVGLHVTSRVYLGLAELSVNLGAWVEGVSFGKRSLREFEMLGDLQGQARALNSLAMNHRYQGQLAETSAYLERALPLFRQMGDQAGVTTCLINLGVLAFDRGDWATARLHLLAALPELRALGDLRLLAIGLLNLATLNLATRQVAGVRDLIMESLHLSRTIDEQAIVAHALTDLADLATVEELWPLASLLLGAAHDLHQRANLPFGPSEQAVFARAETAARAALGEAAYAAACAGGAALTLDEVIAKAIGLPDAPGDSHILG